ncbi:MAG TPA: hypothetical protein VMW63_03120 [Methanoregulaceae archaeon]|nr:hypothetical protein [Methanoregulaceae archaeon]
MQEIGIGEIRVRFRGVTEDKARASLDGIENDVLVLLGNSVYEKRHIMSLKTVADDIDTENIKCRKGVTAGEIRAELAGRIAGIVRGRL